LTPNEEVADVLHVPLSHLAHPGHRCYYQFPPDPHNRHFPGIRFQSHTIWGLTHRAVANFLRLIGVHLDTTPRNPS